MKTGRKVLEVFYCGKKVGILAKTLDWKIAFEYDSEWLTSGFSLNPFSLPLQKGVFLPEKHTFDGLFGIFGDSLPDSWGNVIVDRTLKKHGIEPEKLTILDRLAIVGSDGRGALEYVPQFSIGTEDEGITLEELAEESRNLLEEKESESMDLLFERGGSSGGARPKVNWIHEGEEWIVKFPYSGDGTDSGRMEYEYSICAKKCGIDMAETKLFESNWCSGCFGTRRFDRPKRHMASVAALLELDFELPSLDYSDLFKLTKILTASVEDQKQMYRRMCFNVHAVNMDDHAKNFTYVHDEKSDSWRLSPAYDLTHLITGFGEHWTTINGKGKDITHQNLVEAGIRAGLDERFCKEAESEVDTLVHEMLGKYVE